MSARDHLAAVRALRDTRAYRRQTSLLAPIIEAVEFLLDEPANAEDILDHVGALAVMPVTVPPSLDAATATEESSDTEEVRVAGSWDVRLLEPPPASRAAKAVEAEKAVRKRLNTRAGRAEIKQRSRRVLGAAPSAVSPRRSVATPETVEALKTDGPKTFQVNLYV